MGTAKFKITFEALRDALLLPEDTEILHIVQCGEFRQERTLLIMVEHPSLPKRLEGEMIISIDPIWEMRHKLEFKDWGL